MKIESVTAHAFGPLAGATLVLAPGLTVVAGTNESAKSSWHAAIYAALCGQKRGRGKRGNEEQEFFDKHKPWHRDDWRVSAIVELADGRRVELTQELIGKVACRALDTALARDVSNEIMSDGSPDASRWLGLDRRSFAATACVSQAKMLRVTAEAGGLQQHLQRAAASSTADTTAAAALGHLDTFLREHVGTERSNSVKPLRKAQLALHEAESAYLRARHEHSEYIVLLEQSEKLRNEADLGARRAASAEETVRALTELLTAWRAWNTAQAAAHQATENVRSHHTLVDRETRRLDRIRRLDARFGGTAPMPLSAQDDLVAMVDQAEAAWRAAPSPLVLHGRTAADLRARLDALPAMPIGDTVVDASIRALADSYRRAAETAENHQSRKPTAVHQIHPSVEAGVTAGPAVLRRLGAELQSAATASDDALASLSATVEHARARQRNATIGLQAAQSKTAEATARAHDLTIVASTRKHHARFPLYGLALIALLAGIVLVVDGTVVAGAALAIVAAAAGVIATLIGTRSTPPPIDPQAHTDVARAEAEVARARQESFEADRTFATEDARHAAAVRQHHDATQRRAGMVARCAELGVPEDAETLLELADHAERVIDSQAAVRAWTDEAALLSDRTEQARFDLEIGLRQRSASSADDVWEAFTMYEAACSARASQAAEAEQRDSFAAALADRMEAEASAREAEGTRAHALELVRGAVSRTGSQVADEMTPAHLLEILSTWRQEWKRRLDETDEKRDAWTELTTMLAGATVASLESNLVELGKEQLALEGISTKAEAAAAEARTHCETLATACSVPADAAGINAALDQARTTRTAASTESGEMATVADLAEGALVERRRVLPDLTEAEEGRERARLAHAKVVRLGETLELTKSYLRRAQESAHRDIAPVLNGTLRKWLPLVTDNRYVDAAIDPASLAVQVCGTTREWRDGSRLSVGTVEQVHLLLRVALVQHLTVAGESCPLLLDDVTVQADDVRTEAILDLLLALSEQRQIVLFSQETSVLRWAEQHLGDDRHALRHLTPVSSV